MRCCVLLVALFSAPIWAADPVILDLWPGKVPGETADLGPEKLVPPKGKENPPTQRITNITRATLTLIRPEKDKDTGVCMVICPGGGYNYVTYDKEGLEVAKKFAEAGISGAVLKYRVPRRASDDKDKTPTGSLQDGQRAIRLLRSKAKELGLDEKRIGIMGFSAGGNLAAAVATRFEMPAYEKIDAIDEQNCRPDFAVMIYPAYLISKATGKLSDDYPVTTKTPPCLFVHASNDGVSSENSVQLYLALKKVKSPSELHLYATGGHAFGVRPTGQPVDTWPTRCLEWMIKQGILKRPS